jgi:hypothetical protein
MNNVDAAACVGACGVAGLRDADRTFCEQRSLGRLRHGELDGSEWCDLLHPPMEAIHGPMDDRVRDHGDGPCSWANWSRGSPTMFRVRTECTGGSSAYSPISSFTTPCAHGGAVRRRRSVYDNDIIGSDCVCAGATAWGFVQRDRQSRGQRSRADDRFGRSAWRSAGTMRSWGQFSKMTTPRRQSARPMLPVGLSSSFAVAAPGPSSRRSWPATAPPVTNSGSAWRSMGICHRGGIPGR